MIFGIGTDIVQIERIARLHERFGPRFAERLLLPEEGEAFEGHSQPVRFLAMRFAAKEAIVKAMGTGFSNGMWIRDTGIVRGALGRPEIVWSARGRALCAQLGIGDGHITLSDEAGFVVAVAVLMKK
jgi:holo-[acyl-carrier protein] synthase